ncbi:MAG: hypothetical protein LC623_08445 [Halobacteriales archaeon]|nr:hypothetical protein [Halobacteriales archaeon]
MLGAWLHPAWFSPSRPLHPAQITWENPAEHRDLASLRKLVESGNLAVLDGEEAWHLAAVVDQSFRGETRRTYSNSAELLFYPEDIPSPMPMTARVVGWNRAWRTSKPLPYDLLAATEVDIVVESTPPGARFVALRLDDTDYVLVYLSQEPKTAHPTATIVEQLLPEALVLLDAAGSSLQRAYGPLTEATSVLWKEAFGLRFPNDVTSPYEAKASSGSKVEARFFSGIGRAR